LKTGSKGGRERADTFVEVKLSDCLYAAS